jgi:RNA polymerase sigma factor (sigma-70 family)
LTDNFSQNAKRRIFSAECPFQLRENYKRSQLVENQIKEVFQFSENDFSSRLQVKDSNSEKYLKGETLVCLLNLARAESLYHIEDLIGAKLARICENLIRKFLKGKGFGENFIEEAVGALVFEMFTQILERKEKSYDFWEVNFYVSLQRLTNGYLRKHGSKANLTDTFSELSTAENEDEFNFESNLPEYENLTAQEKLEIKQILIKMSDEHRKIFILYAADGWTQEQIAEVFGFTARTVRNRLRQIDEFLQSFRSSQGDGK